MERMRRNVPNSTQDEILKNAIWIEDFLSISNLKGITCVKKIYPSLKNI